MKVVNDKMYFKNKLFFVAYIEEDDYKKFDCLTNIVVDEPQDLDSKKLVKILRILDLFTSFRTQDFSHIVDEVNLLREDIFQLIKEKMEGKKLWNEYY